MGGWGGGGGGGGDLNELEAFTCSVLQTLNNCSHQPHPDIYLLHAHAGIAGITSYLHPLDRTAVINLGLVLGLDFNRLRTMMDSQTFLQDMLAGWLQRVDRVLQTGAPTWKRLVEALKDPRVGHNGIASKIKQDKD